MNPTLIRASSRAAMRPVARPAMQSHTMLRRQAIQARRGYASDSGSGGGNNQGVVLAALAAIAVGGYFYLKPVRDVAAKVNSGLEKAQDLTKTATDTAQAAGQKAVDVGKDAADQVKKSDGDVLSVATNLANKYLPGIATAATGGGLGGLLSKLKDTDIGGALETLKKTGNDEITQVVDIVQKKLKEADDKVENIDWKELATELNKELGGKYKGAIDTLIGKIPTADDFNELAEKLKSESKEKLKGLEAAANKVYKNVEEAAKDKSLSADAFVEGLKKSSGEDLDKFAKEVKALAKDAGLPADSAIDYAVSKTRDGVDSAEQYAKELQEKFNQYAKWLPVDEEDAVKAASAISPSLGKIVKELLDEAKAKTKEVQDTIEKGKDAIKKGGDKKEEKDGKKDEKKDKK